MAVNLFHPWLIFLYFIFLYMGCKILIINFLRILQSKHKKIYEKFGKPTLAFNDYGRDEVAWWNIMITDFKKYPQLQKIKFFLIIISSVTILLALYIISVGIINKIYS